MTLLSWAALTMTVFAVLFFFYTYLGYPVALWIIGRFRPPFAPAEAEFADWPFVSICVPVYNEEAQIDGLIQSLRALDYPRDRLQILIVSDASSDRTNEIVRGYAAEGIELLRIPERGGKTHAESAAAKELIGVIVVNTDASIRIDPSGLKPLIVCFSDPSVGLASGRDISVGAKGDRGNVGESGYVGYEMGIRDLETRVSGIVGASGCFYAIRADLHSIPLPPHLSRDFAAALHTRENGYRAVSVPRATCSVPRTSSLRKEYWRKVRTITRGMETLSYNRKLLNPLRFGVFSWMLLSHKIFRWALPWAAAVGFVGICMFSVYDLWARVVLGVGISILLLAAIGWYLDRRRELPKLLGVPAYLVAGNLAAMRAFIRFLRNEQDPVWEPTRRQVVDLDV